MVYPSGFSSYDSANAGLEHVPADVARIDWSQRHSRATAGYRGISCGASDHAVPLHELEAAAKMLKRMWAEKGMEKVQSIAGAAATFGQFAAPQHLRSS